MERRRCKASPCFPADGQPVSVCLSICLCLPAGLPACPPACPRACACVCGGYGVVVVRCGTVGACVSVRLCECVSVSSMQCRGRGHLSDEINQETPVPQQVKSINGLYVLLCIPRFNTLMQPGLIGSTGGFGYPCDQGKAPAKHRALHST